LVYLYFCNVYSFPFSSPPHVYQGQGIAVYHIP